MQEATGNFLNKFYRQRDAEIIKQAAENGYNFRFFKIFIVYNSHNSDYTDGLCWVLVMFMLGFFMRGVKIRSVIKLNFTLPGHFFPCPHYRLGQPERSWELNFS